MDLEDKLSLLKNLLLELQSVIIAFSGGTDSTLLAKIAADTLGDKALSVTAVSNTYTPEELEQATELVQSLNLNHKIIYTNEIDNKDFSSNTPERCYHCKKTLMKQLIDIAQKENYNYVVDGSNVDDLDDFRPGHKAVQELGIRSPLQEIGFTKNEIRYLSKSLGLPTWNKPALACLASRIPYGSEITKEKLSRIAKSEDFLRSMGLSPTRVRDYGHSARIEVDFKQFPEVIANKDKIVQHLKDLGYVYITLDLAGLRSGSMNEVLESNIRNNY